MDNYQISNAISSNQAIAICRPVETGYPYTASGVTFKAQHFSKQSRPSKPLADFFYISFPKDSLLCPVVTLQAYESKTLEFRDQKSEDHTLSLKD